MRWMMGGCLLVLLGCSGADSNSDPARPPVLLITVDGLVATDLEPFGGAQPMPGLQRLMDSGTAWPHALSAAPMTRPAVATYLTGVAPDRHAVRDDLFAVLPAEIPTLAERLLASGYRTAGFPDSSFLPERSGLWRGFEAVDEPPPVEVSPSRWLPRVRPSHRTLEAFSTWLDSLEDDAEWFGWVHLSYPLVGQLKQQYFVAPKGEGSQPAEPVDTEAEGDAPPEALMANEIASYEEALAEFDTLVGSLLDRVDARADGSKTWIFLGGTMGDQRRDESLELPGLGYSLAGRKVGVPVIVRAPQGSGLRGAADEVWSLDVAATIAATTGVDLSPAVEGVSLTDPAPDRTLFSWSWALLDQMGWRALTLARNGDREWVAGAVSDDPTEDSAAAADLAQALEARATPQRQGLPEDVVAALIELSEIEPDPLPGDGRDYADATKRKRVAAGTWAARGRYQMKDYQTGGQFFSAVKHSLDPQNYIAHLDHGQMMALYGLAHVKKVTRKTVRLRPDDPESWHWYAHALWRESVEDAERIISAIQPYLANQSDALYDLACARSLAGDLQVSADYLERAFRAGFRDRRHILADTDLRNLRESEYFSEVMQRLY